MAGLAELSGHQVVGVLRAEYAEAAKAQARVLAAVWETALCDRNSRDTTERMTWRDEFSAAEVRAALGLTRAAAETLVDFAYSVVFRLPALHEAMAAGELDDKRARTFTEWTLDLADSHALAICEQLLPLCALSADTRLTTGKLVERIKDLAIAMDPLWAQRRYESALAEGKVVAGRNPDGTAYLTGKNLPLERVAASSHHINALASRAKAAGDRRPMDAIRSQLYLGMTDGTYLGLNREQIVQAVAQPRPAANADAADAGTEGAPGTSPPTTPSPQPSWAGVQVKVRLTTLLGLDSHPGELVGWGPITDVHARRLVRELSAGQWRWDFTDTHGHLLRTGLTPARPHGYERRSASCDAVIEIVVSAVDLVRIVDGDLATTLDPETLRTWRPLVMDLNQRLDTEATAPPPAVDPRRRFPGTALRREVLTAIARCVGVGCRTPASSSQVDHRHDHARGGDTVKENLEPACSHDHRLKTEAGWQLRLLETPTGPAFEWTTRLGHTYLEPVDPILPHRDALPDRLHERPKPLPAPPLPRPRPTPEEDDAPPS